MASELDERGELSRCVMVIIYLRREERSVTLCHTGVPKIELKEK